MISTNTMNKILAIIEGVASFTQGVATYLKLRNIIPQTPPGGGAATARRLLALRDFIQLHVDRV